MIDSIFQDINQLQTLCFFVVAKILITCAYNPSDIPRYHGHYTCKNVMRAAFYIVWIKTNVMDISQRLPLVREMEL